VPGLIAAMSLVLAAGVSVNLLRGVSARAINRNSGNGLINSYERIRIDGLAAAYRYECDFMDTAKGRVRESLAPSCTTAGRAHTILLWGDSFAQALSLGLRESLPASTSLAQVATSGCTAALEHDGDSRCARSNAFALQTIGRLHPDAVVIAQSEDHATTDWAALTKEVLLLGARRVVVIGPAPMWRPTLPRVYAEHHMADHAAYVSTGLEMRRFNDDRVTAALVSPLDHVSYLSLMDHLCNGGACLARVPDGEPLDLMAVDFGHLSPKGSSYLGRAIWKPYLESLIAK
jgi:hypothetical protein